MWAVKCPVRARAGRWPTFCSASCYPGTGENRRHPSWVSHNGPHSAADRSKI